MTTHCVIYFFLSLMPEKFPFMAISSHNRSPKNKKLILMQKKVKKEKTRFRTKCSSSEGKDHKMIHLVWCMIRN